MPASGRVPTAQAVLFLVLLTLLSLAVRLLFFQRFRWEGMECDGAGYLDVARHILAGQGWSVDYVQLLFRPLVSLPRPDAQWSPLYPFLTALAVAAGGLNITAVKLVPLAFGMFTPAAASLLAFGLTGRRLAGLFAGLLAVAYPTLVSYSMRVETESCTILLVSAVLICLLLRPRRAWLLGALLAAAYLMKYQSVWLWIAVSLGLFWRLPRAEAWRALGIAALTFLVLCSPWLVRNALLFGDPLHTDLPHLVLAQCPDFGGGQRVVASLTPPPPALRYAILHPAAVATRAHDGLRMLTVGLLRDNGGSAWLAPLALLGLWSIRARWKLWVPVLVYAGLLFGFISVTLTAARYGFCLVPFWAALAGAGAGWLASASAQRKVGVRVMGTAAGVVLVVASIAGEARETARQMGDHRSGWNPGASSCPVEMLASRPFIVARTA
ncbi:MAG TPA: hypothetical protein VMS93_07160 [Candidatus Saccharimonadales bacterium]|nr:hypothetical protein [Candidatus Saccharimonadales bacterium]